jgi:hypothetical protein
MQLRLRKKLFLSGSGFDFGKYLFYSNNCRHQKVHYSILAIFKAKDSDDPLPEKGQLRGPMSGEQDPDLTSKFEILTLDDLLNISNLNSDTEGLADNITENTE